MPYAHILKKLNKLFEASYQRIWEQNGLIAVALGDRKIITDSYNETLQQNLANIEKERIINLDGPSGLNTYQRNLNEAQQQQITLISEITALIQPITYLTIEYYVHQYAELKRRIDFLTDLIKTTRDEDPEKIKFQQEYNQKEKELAETKSHIFKITNADKKQMKELLNKFSSAVNDYYSTQYFITNWPLQRKFDDKLLETDAGKRPSDIEILNEAYGLELQLRRKREGRNFDANRTAYYVFNQALIAFCDKLEFKQEQQAQISDEEILIHDLYSIICMYQSLLQLTSPNTLFNNVLGTIESELTDIINLEAKLEKYKLHNISHPAIKPLINDLKTLANQGLQCIRSFNPPYYFAPSKLKYHDPLKEIKLFLGVPNAVDINSVLEQIDPACEYKQAFKTIAQKFLNNEISDKQFYCELIHYRNQHKPATGIAGIMERLSYLWPSNWGKDNNSAKHWNFKHLNNFIQIFCERYAEKQIKINPPSYDASLIEQHKVRIQKRMDHSLPKRAAHDSTAASYMEIIRSQGTGAKRTEDNLVKTEQKFTQLFSRLDHNFKRSTPGNVGKLTYTQTRQCKAALTQAYTIELEAFRLNAELEESARNHLICTR